MLSLHKTLTRTSTRGCNSTSTASLYLNQFRFDLERFCFNNRKAGQYAPLQNPGYLGSLPLKDKYGGRWAPLAIKRYQRSTIRHLTSQHSCGMLQSISENTVLCGLVCMGCNNRQVCRAALLSTAKSLGLLW